jgi:threonine/homoserine/homoserine lactone efflux protein
MDSSNWLLFCATVLALILMPGPDIIYVTTRGIAQGRRAALVLIGLGLRMAVPGKR